MFPGGAGGHCISVLKSFIQGGNVAYICWLSSPPPLCVRALFFFLFFFSPSF